MGLLHRCVFSVVGNSSHAESGGDDAFNCGIEIAFVVARVGPMLVAILISLEISSERELGLEWRAGILFYLGVGLKGRGGDDDGVLARAPLGSRLLRA